MSFVQRWQKDFGKEPVNLEYDQETDSWLVPPSYAMASEFAFETYDALESVKMFVTLAANAVEKGVEPTIAFKFFEQQILLYADMRGIPELYKIVREVRDKLCIDKITLN